MKRFYRLLALIFALAMLFTLASCGGGGKKETVTTGEEPAKSSERLPDDPEPWLDEDSRIRLQNDAYPVSEALTILEIHESYFVATTVMPLPNTIRINGVLPDKWCVGDHFTGTFKNVYQDDRMDRYEADLVTIEESDFELDPDVCYKPVVYLYPETETKARVLLDLDGELTCTYPAYRDLWRVAASPDGTLTDEAGQTYNYLYWEGTVNADFDFSRGFCVKGEDTARFLEDALAKLGLTRREANEFIVFWLPRMEGNAYNLIAFQTDAYTDAARLEISPEPDCLIRVFMAYRPLTSFVEVEAQELTAPARRGFVAVEWGGAAVS